MVCRHHSTSSRIARLAATRSTSSPPASLYLLILNALRPLSHLQLTFAGGILSPVESVAGRDLAVCAIEVAIYRQFPSIVVTVHVTTLCIYTYSSMQSISRPPYSVMCVLMERLIMGLDGLV